MSFDPADKQAQQDDVQKLGIEVARFMKENEMKAQYVRMASHFGTSKFTSLKKVS